MRSDYSMAWFALVLSLVSRVGLSASSPVQPPSAGSPAQKAEHILQLAGYPTNRPGIALDLGCRDGALAVAIARQTKLFVQCVVPDEVTLERVRKTIDAEGLYGTRIAVEPGSSGRLPYPDYLANLIICGDPRILPDAGELIRLLNPNGAALIQGWRDRTAVGSVGNLCDSTPLNDGWIRITRRRPDTWGEWSHRAGDAGNTYGSEDQSIRPPFRLQWMDDCPPGAVRSTMLVVGGGRMFSLSSHYAPSPTNPEIKAYDAYNGTPLWSRSGVDELPIDWTWRHYTPKRTCSDVVATDDALYLLAGKVCCVFDPDTGEIRRSLSLPAGAEETVRDLLGRRPPPDVLPQIPWHTEGYRLRGDSPPVWLYVAVSGGHVIGAGGPSPQNAGSIRSSIMFRGWSQLIFSIDPATGKTLWTTRDQVLTQSIACGGGRVFYVDEKCIPHALDIRTGQHLWSGREPVAGRNEVVWLGSYYRGRYSATVEGLQGGVRVNLFAADDGRPVTAIKASTASLSAAGGFMYLGEPIAVVDALTGQSRSAIKGINTGGCTPPIATASGSICGRQGVYIGEPSARDTRGQTYLFAGLRNSCGQALTPANGMVYGAAGGCTKCAFSFRADFAVIPGTLPAPEPSGRFVRGPAFGSPGNAIPPAGLPIWATWRGDAQHSGQTRARAGGNLTQRWAVKVSDDTLTPMAAGGGLIYCGSLDGKLYALDAGTGQARWRYYANGPLRIAPYLWEGCVYFGDEGGWTHCLRGEDGTLVWRFRAAPVDDRVVSHGRLTSRWPVAGGVLISEGSAYCVAGLFPNEGLYCYELDARTGAVRWETLYSGGAAARKGDEGVTCQGALSLSADADLLFIPAQGRAPVAISLTKRSEPLVNRVQSYGRGQWHDRGTRIMVVGRIPVVRSEIPDPYRAVAPSALPVVDTEAIYLRDGATLTGEPGGAVRVGNGGIEPRKATWQAWPGACMTAVVLAGETLFSGGYPAKVSIYNRWSPRETIKTIERTGAGHRVYATNAKDGKEVWSARVPGEVTDLAVVDRRLVAACRPGTMVCFEGD